MAIQPVAALTWSYTSKMIHASSWGEPERVANCIWNTHTDMQLFVKPDYNGDTGQRLSFTVEP